MEDCNEGEPDYMKNLHPLAKRRADLLSQAIVKRIQDVRKEKPKNKSLKPVS